jgi:hypothetical protein
MSPNEVAVSFNQNTICYLEQNLFVLLSSAAILFGNVRDQLLPCAVVNADHVRDGTLLVIRVVPSTDCGGRVLHAVVLQQPEIVKHLLADGALIKRLLLKNLFFLLWFCATPQAVSTVGGL